MNDGVYNSTEPVHPAVQEAREVIRLEQQARDGRQRNGHVDALARAVMLAPTLPICEALLRGEQVPLSQLDPRMFRRYGIRRAA